MSLPHATLQCMEPAILPGLAVRAILVLGFLLYVATIPLDWYLAAAQLVHWSRSRALWYWHSGDDSGDRHAAGHRVRAYKEVLAACPRESGTGMPVPKRALARGN
jgi:hypothetical protein